MQWEFCIGYSVYPHKATHLCNIGIFRFAVHHCSGMLLWTMKTACAKNEQQRPGNEGKGHDNRVGT